MRFWLFSALSRLSLVMEPRSIRISPIFLSGSLSSLGASRCILSTEISLESSTKMNTSLMMFISLVVVRIMSQLV